ncbi:Hypothetical protein MexAM1_META2p1150 (plasmid) [Methylorubrum extorquens AM1]|uniref:Uncharacterized protein n=1 Tax=Methylorubrum extorquens (strain ATCC 14718 / DSM 1338 / JCM 2805 / NCIMB 9133 / AM1) TaxID=272630 RepID=C5B638_METEA|nr:Hypothetical protein MexAM1_META2p1150 [Methylorubrum extorquens AM1]
MPRPLSRSRHVRQIAFGGAGRAPRTSDIVLGIVAAALLAGYCLLMVAGLLRGMPGATG